MNPPADSVVPSGDAKEHRDLYGLFESSVELHPERTAIELGADALCYGDLERSANSIAVAIVDRGFEPGTRIGLLATRDLVVYAAYLGILKAGCAVVPLSADAPPARLLAACSSARVPLVFGALAPDPTLGEGGIAYVDLRGTRPAQSAPRRQALPDDLAYVLFTSGSTGTPKGVPITHANAVEYVAYAGARLGVTMDSRLSHAFELTFDPSVFDLFCTWAAGATLVVPDRYELLMPTQYVNRRRVSHWFSVPSVASLAHRAGEIGPGSMPSLEYSQFIGEQLTIAQASAWKSAAPNSRVVNSYGPTELTVACADFELGSDEAAWPETSNDTVPIGGVYPHLDMLVLDGEGRPTDDGELCVRGSQRFGGYLDPGENANRFLSFDGAEATPYVEGDLTPALWYRTGDRVRVESGVLVHVGRLDRQRKIRGYRIELGEIEVALRRLPEIDQAAVTVVDLDYAQGIFATLVGRERPASEMLSALADSLPKYMIPDHFAWRTELPLKANGKLDYTAIGLEAQDLVATGSAR